ncbi:hypothetical protein HELRODRAFT_177541 [Helobdella robusta]|uniref:Uncharacterized protein n=1 Tax=Helobdella robusta TaxID=6412 RepID=T1FBU9_HELRO|nr:hypothetical protein HELRODRAFT_177541 [Helobdella robusta]ESN97891.1 hypothetical protein HELRODRAFT_177541 [Helobdella robusta]
MEAQLEWVRLLFEDYNNAEMHELLAYVNFGKAMNSFDHERVQNNLKQLVQQDGDTKSQPKFQHQHLPNPEFAQSPHFPNNDMQKKQRMKNLVMKMKTSDEPSTPPSIIPSSSSLAPEKHPPNFPSLEAHPTAHSLQQTPSPFTTNLLIVLFPYKQGVGCLKLKEMQQILWELVLGVGALHQVPYMTKKFASAPVTHHPPAYKGTRIHEIMTHVTNVMHSAWCNTLPVCQDSNNTFDHLELRMHFFVESFLACQDLYIFNNRWVLRSALNFFSNGEVVREVGRESQKKRPEKANVDSAKECLTRVKKWTLSAPQHNLHAIHNNIINIDFDHNNEINGDVPTPPDNRQQLSAKLQDLDRLSTYNVYLLEIITMLATILESMAKNDMILYVEADVKKKC